MRDNQQLNFTGGLNQDTTPEYIQNDYTDAADVQHLTQDTESTQSHIPSLGNKQAFTLGSVSTQNKTWRIYTSDTSPTVVTNGLFLFDQNGAAIPSGAINWTADQTVTLQAAALLAAIPAGYSPTVTTDGSTYLDVTLTAIPSYDWGLTATTKIGAPPLITDTEMVYVIFKEAIDETLTGELNVVGSNDLLSDLYVLSTPQRNLPTIQPYGVLTAVTNGLGYTITTSQPHGLVSGQKILIDGVVAVPASGLAPNGFWIITVTGASSFTADELYDVGSGFVLSSAGGTITLYSESIGEIGAAVKDLDIDTWVYKRLLRTKEWDFRTRYQADFRVSQRTESKDSLYWTNGNEAPRVFYYTKPFITDGALAINGGRYAYGSIADET